MKKAFALFIFSMLLIICGLYFVQKLNETRAREKITLWLINQKILAQQSKPQKLQNNIQEGAILGTQDSVIPVSYTLSISPRKQVFNLSCEFAAAAAIIHHYTNDSFFAPQSELVAEKTLIAKISPSLNPNIGVRMGSDATGSAEVMFTNLNNRFGGIEYYGIHAPPFIDLFWEYKLLARPIQKGNIEGVKKAIFSGHLVMAWIRIGFGEPIDIALSYGTTPVIKGEHAVVIYGYNQDGVSIMDPGIGANRFLSYQTLVDATSLFPLPFLEVNPSINEFSYEPTERVDMLTGLDRTAIKVLVQNASWKVGAGTIMAAILKDFGYQVLKIEQAQKAEYEGVNIMLKNELSDYAKLLKQDISLAGYHISSFSATLAPNSSSDVVVVVGE